MTTMGSLAEPPTKHAGGSPERSGGLVDEFLRTGINYNYNDHLFSHLESFDLQAISTLLYADRLHWQD